MNEFKVITDKKKVLNLKNDQAFISKNMFCFMSFLKNFGLIVYFGNHCSLFYIYFLIDSFNYVFYS